MEFQPDRHQYKYSLKLKMAPSKFRWLFATLVGIKPFFLDLQKRFGGWNSDVFCSFVLFYSIKSFLILWDDDTIEAKTLYQIHQDARVV